MAILLFRKYGQWTREMAQQLRVSVVLAEDPGSIPSTHMMTQNLLKLQFKKSDALF